MFTTMFYMDSFQFQLVFMSRFLFIFMTNIGENKLLAVAVVILIRNAYIS